MIDIIAVGNWLSESEHLQALSLASLLFLFIPRPGSFPVSIYTRPTSSDQKSVNGKTYLAEYKTQFQSQDPAASRPPATAVHGFSPAFILLSELLWLLAVGHETTEQNQKLMAKSQKLKAKCGFVLTLDALLAVILLLMAVALLGTEWFRPLAPDGLYLKQISFDTLYLLESTGRLDRAVGGNATAVREVFEILPKSVCMQVAIEDSQGANIATIARLDCGSYHRELQTAYSTFIYSGGIYKARLESWYRKET